MQHFSVFSYVFLAILGSLVIEPPQPTNDTPNQKIALATVSPSSLRSEHIIGPMDNRGLWKIDHTGATSPFMSTVVSVNTDTDADNVSDSDDLDDDNDGILDINEGCGNSTNISGTIGIGSNVSNTMYSLVGTTITYARAGANEATLSGYTAGSQGNAIRFSASGTASGSLNSTFSTPIASVYFKLTDFDEYEDYTVDVYDENNVLYDLTSTGVLSVGTTINQTGNQFVCITSETTAGGPSVDGNNPSDDGLGSVIFFFPGKVSQIVITYSHSLSSSVRFIEPVFCSIDTDGDGMLDYLDLDSDNDNCPDVVEGGAGFSYTQVENDTLIGGVDANGVPLIASGGQSIGTAQDNTLQSTNCDPCDSDNPAFVDSDNDLIGDLCDLDDDNDGIPDLNECPTLAYEQLDWSSETYPSGGASQAYTIGGHNLTISVADPSGALANIPPQMPAVASFYQGDGTAADHTFLIACDIGTLGTTNTVTTTIDLGVPTEGLHNFSFSLFDVDGDYGASNRQEEYIITGTLNGVPSTWVMENIGTVTRSVDTITGFDPTPTTGGGSINGAVRIAFDSPVDQVNIIFKLADGTITSGGATPGFGLHDLHFNLPCDTDNDGIFNSFDLDADNDGIYDLVESGHPATDADNNGVIDGAVSLFGTNGLFDAIETSADSDIINYAISDSENTPDGIYDAYKLDADGDTCFDALEEAISDPDTDGIAGTGVPVVDAKGLVTSITYATPVNNTWQNYQFRPCLPEICNNGIDNDSDSYIDCFDSDCPCYAPFNCNVNALYQTQRLSVDISGEGVTNDFVLYRIDPVTANFVFVANLTDNGLATQINSIGFNPIDGFIYGINNNGPYTLYRINSLGQIENLGDITGMTGQNEAGAIDVNGDYYITGSSGNLYRVDIATLTATLVSSSLFSVSDIAINPIDGQIYTWRNSTKQLNQINPSTGVATPIGSPNPQYDYFGAMYFNTQGDLIAYGDDTAISATSQETLAKIDIITGVVIPLGTGPGTNTNDGCSCAYGVEITKAAVDTLCPGYALTYTFTIFNRSGSILNNINFEDTVTNGLTFSSNPYIISPGLSISGSTNALTEANLVLNNIPTDTSSFKIDVSIPGTYVGSNPFTNTSYLNNLSANLSFLPDTIASDNAYSEAISDATETIIRTEICNNGIDDDCDGLTDCEDSECCCPKAPVLSK